MAKLWVVDDEVSPRFPIYTRGNVGEVFPDVVAPLTWSCFGPRAEAGWRRAFTSFGAFTPADYGETPMAVLGVFGGYCYLNVSLIRIFAVRTPGLTVELMDRTFFGESDAPAYAPQASDKNLAASAREGRTLLRTLRAKSLPRLDRDRARVVAWLAGLPDVDAATDQELIDAFLGYRPLFEDLFETHILTTFQATIGPGLLDKVCAGKLGDPTLANTLLAGIGSIESAAPSTALWILGRIVEGDDELTAVFDAGLSGLEDRLAEAGGPAADQFGQRFARFLAEYGSRGPNEWEFAADTWGTRPALALAAIDRLRLTDPAHAPTAQHSRLERERLLATAEARRRLQGTTTRSLFDLALRSSQLFSQGRERSKTTVIRATHGARLCLRELARRARDRGGPDDLHDICLVTGDELASFVADPKPLASVIAERAALGKELAALSPPFVFEGSQPPMSTWARRDTPAVAAPVGATLTGIAGCPGVARGRARVVLDPLDPRGLAPGEVLVAPITDPSWTPLFVSSDGVVVDVGAQMSHAVIVSRELGIPAVVSVTGATRTIPDGALIEVDGTRGTVTILEI